jgi:ADP-ribosyl-[dinitrogen reductase] hydrolase
MRCIVLTTTQRYRGCLLGLACGDAVGTTVEFKPRGSFTPLTDMVGGGPFDLPAGAWTDDCSMALCLAHSLLYCKGFDARDQMNRYRNWQEHGYMSSTGRCFDIGMTVSAALNRYRQTGDPFSGSPDPRSAGNGALMRLAPVPLFFGHNRDEAVHFAGESARTTHGAAEAIDSARLFAAQLCVALAGGSKNDIVLNHGYAAQTPKVQALASGSWREKSEAQIVGSGYAIASLEAALWCFWHSDSFSDAILRAANLGDDADTTAAIGGQLAGAFYGKPAIPASWLQKLVMREEIADLATQLFERGPAAH